MFWTEIFIIFNFMSLSKLFSQASSIFVKTWWQPKNEKQRALLAHKRIDQLSSHSEYWLQMLHYQSNHHYYSMCNYSRIAHPNYHGWQIQNIWPQTDWSHDEWKLCFLQSSMSVHHLMRNSKNKFRPHLILKIEFFDLPSVIAMVTSVGANEVMTSGVAASFKRVFDVPFQRWRKDSLPFLKPIAAIQYYINVQMHSTQISMNNTNF